jgi:hypothetical protein
MLLLDVLFIVVAEESEPSASVVYGLIVLILVHDGVLEQVYLGQG